FARICDRAGEIHIASEEHLADRYRKQAKRLAADIEASAWDGEWYQRATFDDGTPLGSASSLECQIDSIAQSWAVLSGAGEPGRARQAMQSVMERLVRPEERLILLFTPPFNEIAQDPGYIKGYLPGIRENGGQYTHAATWTAWAMARLGDGATAGKLVNLLNPVYQSDTPQKAAVYRVEPYVIAADIYSVAPYIRRGGWTWYTGSGSWMYRLGMEALLGLHKEGDVLWVDPAIPPEWDGFEITYLNGKTPYHILVRNPQHVAHGVKSVRLNGAEVQGVPLMDDGGNHTVEVVLGE
ncbi:MAG: glycosyltransferase 36 associated protein, partial [Anaerolineaceae bacterium]|nr:glycosyltransferase 36 associated protein [Anaerolineaceae bacterium]